MTYNFLRACALLGLASLALPSMAAEPVQVSQSGREFVLSVNERVSLRTVLDRFCTQTKTRCEGVEQTDAMVVVPITVRGTWESVLARLMEGSGFNYLSNPPAGPREGRLIIRTRPQGSEAALAPQVARPAIHSQPSVASFPAPPAVTAPPNPQPAAEQEPPAATTSFTPPSSRPAAARPVQVQTSQGLSASPLTSSMSLGDGGSSPSGHPFPIGKSGNLPTSDEPAAYLPFPDSKGRPIPATSTGEGSPFPHEAVRQTQPGPKPH